MFRFVIAFSLILFCSGISVHAFDGNRLDGVMRDYSSANGPCTAIILDPSDGHIAYVYNRRMAYGGCYPPGSIMKTLTAAVLLATRSETGFNPVTPVRCTGSYHPGPNTFQNHEDTQLFNLSDDGHFPCSLKAGHGMVDLRSALVYSCNTYFLTAVSADPRGFHRKLIAMWHLNDGTGLPDGDVPEAMPVILTPSSGFQYAASLIGEGGLVRLTPLKITQVYGSIFEGTPLLVPHENRGKRGPVMQYPLALPPADLGLLRGALASNLDRGTLKGMKSSGPAAVILSGKTGTASMYGKRYSNHGWAVLHLKSGNRTYVMTVFVLNGTGPRHARKLAQELCDAL